MDEVQISLTNNEFRYLIQHYVSTTMSPASQEQFAAELNATNNMKEALFTAVINESVNNALTAFISGRE